MGSILTPVPGMLGIWRYSNNVWMRLRNTFEIVHRGGQRRGRMCAAMCRGDLARGSAGAAETHIYVRDSQGGGTWIRSAWTEGHSLPAWQPQVCSRLRAPAFWATPPRLLPTRRSSRHLPRASPSRRRSTPRPVSSPSTTTSSCATARAWDATATAATA